MRVIPVELRTIAALLKIGVDGVRRPRSWRVLQAAFRSGDWVTQAGRSLEGLALVSVPRATATQLESSSVTRGGWWRPPRASASRCRDRRDAGAHACDTRVSA